MLCVFKFLHDRLLSLLFPYCRPSINCPWNLLRSSHPIELAVNVLLDFDYLAYNGLLVFVIVGLVLVFIDSFNLWVAWFFLDSLPLLIVLVNLVGLVKSQIPVVVVVASLLTLISPCFCKHSIHVCICSVSLDFITRITQTVSILKRILLVIT